MNRKYQGHEKTWNLLYKNWLQRDCDAKHGKASTKIGKTWKKIVERWTGLANHDDHSDPTKSLFGVDRGDIWGHQKTDKQLVPSFLQILWLVGSRGTLFVTMFFLFLVGACLFVRNQVGPNQIIRIKLASKTSPDLSA